MTPLVRQAVLLALAGALSVPTAVRAQEAAPAELPRPFELTRPRDGDGPLSGLLRLREGEAAYLAADPSMRGTYAQYRAQAEAAVGEHAAALRFWDLPYPSQTDTAALPPEARDVDAAIYLARAAEDVRIVMMNEAHHDAASRLLTLELLPQLWARGYRYFAAETFAPDSVLAAAPGYPTARMGYYTDEPVFGAVVREALRLGYTLVPYEIEEADEVEGDTLSRQQRRDLTQAERLIARTLAHDPEARVLVHAGFGHVYEEADEDWTPMAYYLQQLTGVDPLTVDQVEMGERSTSAYEAGLYRAVAGALEAGPVVLLDGETGRPVPPAGAAVDVQVFRPRTAYVGGRPRWMDLGGRLRALPPVELPAVCAATVCLVEVRRADEGTDAVPVDRAVATGASVTVYAPTDAAAVVSVVDGHTGAVLQQNDAPAP